MNLLINSLPLKIVDFVNIKILKMKKYLQVGNRIRQIRGQLSQEKFGNLWGVTKSAISNYELGRVPELGMLERIAQMGNTTVEWILRGDVEYRPPRGKLTKLSQIARVWISRRI